MATIRKPITGKQGHKHGGWNRAGQGEHLAPGREVRDRTGKALLRHLGSWRAGVRPDRPVAGDPRGLGAGLGAVHRDREARDDRAGPGAARRTQAAQDDRPCGAAPARSRTRLDRGRRGAARPGRAARADRAVPQLRRDAQPRRADRAAGAAPALPADVGGERRACRGRAQGAVRRRAHRGAARRRGERGDVRAVLRGSRPGDRVRRPRGRSRAEPARLARVRRRLGGRAHRAVARYRGARQRRGPAARPPGAACRGRAPRTRARSRCCCSRRSARSPPSCPHGTPTR